jgi:hypothetical protein
MKLSLTVDLMNLSSTQSPLPTIKSAMEQFKAETGGFKRLFRKNREVLANGLESQTYAMQYENCTLDLDLITDLVSDQQIVQGFTLTENLS